MRGFCFVGDVATLQRSCGDDSERKQYASAPGVERGTKLVEHGPSLVEHGPSLLEVDPNEGEVARIWPNAAHLWSSSQVGSELVVSCAEIGPNLAGYGCDTASAKSRQIRQNMADTCRKRAKRWSSSPTTGRIRCEIRTASPVIGRSRSQLPEIAPKLASIDPNIGRNRQMLVEIAENWPESSDIGKT